MTAAPDAETSGMMGGAFTRSLRVVHATVGVGGLLAFLSSGLHMRSIFPEAYEAHEAVRFLYRANHIYLLFASLLNLVLARYVVAPQAWARRVAQLLGSSGVVSAVPILAAAFLVEPRLGGGARGLTLLGCIVALAGVILHAAVPEPGQHR